jgi:hypothetical protein
MRLESGRRLDGSDKHAVEMQNEDEHRSKGVALEGGL